MKPSHTSLLSRSFSVLGILHLVTSAVLLTLVTLRLGWNLDFMLQPAADNDDPWHCALPSAVAVHFVLMGMFCIRGGRKIAEFDRITAKHASTIQPLIKPN